MRLILNNIHAAANRADTRKQAPAPSGGTIKKVVSDFKQGKELGKEILGEEGLGRIREQSQIQDVEQRMLEQAEGFSGAETTARRERELQRIQGSGQARERALQAQLARSGVKGGAAAEQLLASAGQGIQQRAQMERDLFLAGEDARRAGTQQLAQFQTGTTQFDIGQAAAEKNIMAQSGLSAAQIASAERSGERQALAAERGAAASARAQGGGGGLLGSVFCFLPDTMIEMQDGSKKAIQTLKKGDMTLLGGAVESVRQELVADDIYEYKGTFATASHEVYENGVIVTLADSEHGRLAYSGGTHIVYPLNTENGIYIANDFISTNSEGNKLVNSAEMAFKLFQIADELVKGKSNNMSYEELLDQISKLLTNARIDLMQDERYSI
jgi:hypothetical protein